MITARPANDNTQPLFIIGTERSGSNLLRLMLNAHPNICIPHPPHIMHFMGNIEASYGDLHRDNNFLSLVNAVLRLIKLHIYPWDVTLNPANIAASAPSRDLFGIFVATYNACLAASGKLRWGCKSTFMIEYTDKIFEVFPGAKLIWLVRDPRDVAVSSMTSVFNPCHPWCTAKLWRRQQQMGMAISSGQNRDHIFRLHYEELIADPVTTIKTLCAFIEEPFDDDMLNFFNTDEARQSGALSESWKNTTRPVMSNNAGKYKKRLSGTRLHAVEQVAGDLMVALGYVPDSADWKNPAIGLVTASRFWLVDRYLFLCVQARSLWNDKNVHLRMARRLYLCYLYCWKKLSAQFCTAAVPGTPD